MNSVDFSRFHRIAPDPDRNSACTVTVMRDDTVHVTGRLTRSFGPGAAVFLDLSEDGEQLLLRRAERGTQGAFTLPQNGIFRSQRLGRELAGHLPVRYAAEWLEEAGAWLCTRDGSYVPPVPKPSQKRLRTPRKTDLAAMLPRKGGAA